MVLFFEIDWFRKWCKEKFRKWCKEKLAQSLYVSRIHGLSSRFPFKDNCLQNPAVPPKHHCFYRIFHYKPSRITLLLRTLFVPLGHVHQWRMGLHLAASKCCIISSWGACPSINGLINKINGWNHGVYRYFPGVHVNCSIGSIIIDPLLSTSTHENWHTKIHHEFSTLTHSYGQLEGLGRYWLLNMIRYEII